MYYAQYIHTIIRFFLTKLHLFHTFLNLLSTKQWYDCCLDRQSASIFMSLNNIYTSTTTVLFFGFCNQLDF